MQLVRPNFLKNKSLSRKQLLGSSIGLVTGIVLFFNVSSFLGFVAGSLFTGLFFLLLEALLEKIWKKNLSGFLRIFALILIALIVPAILVMSSTACLMAVYSLDYNPLNDKCTVNTYTCNVERPWYQSECSGQNLKQYCERQDFSSTLENGDKPSTRGHIGYSKCKEADYIEE